MQMDWDNESDFVRVVFKTKRLSAVSNDVEKFGQKLGRFVPGERVSSEELETLNTGAKPVLMDLSGIDSLDSSAVGKLLFWLLRMRKVGCKVGLVVSKDMVDMLSILKIQNICRFYESTDAALNDFANWGQPVAR